MTITQNYRKDFIGQKFGRLTITGFNRRIKTPGSQHSLWTCRCDCGNSIIVKRGSLTSGNTRSCGCLASEMTVQRNIKHLSDKELNAIHKLQKVYEGSARRRGLEFSINRNVFEDLTKSNCFYCGIEPSQFIKSIWGDTYRYNGLDRVDNTKGYTHENCVPCCKKCNIAKGTMSYDEFISWIKRLAEHNT